MIEVGRLEDVGRMVQLGEMMHAESDYRGIPYSRVKVAALLTRLMVSDGVVFVSRKDGVIVGGIAGGVTEHWFSDEKVGFEYSFMLAPEARHGITAARLMRAFRVWCASQGAKTIKMGITTGINVEGTSRFYRSQGLKDAGVLFSMEV